MTQQIKGAPVVQRKPLLDIRAQAFIDAREKRGLSVNELANLACLSNKQIQQIENGQTDAFYSPFIKFTAAKKVATLLELEEQEAFDLGLPAAPAELHEVPAQFPEQPALEVKAHVKEARPETQTVKPAAPVVAAKPESKQAKQAKAAAPEEKKPSNKLVWLIPIAAIALAVVQFQPLIEQELDAFMAKTATEAEPAPVVASAPPADAPPTASAPANEPSPATLVAPVVASAPVSVACPAADGTVENYKPPYANKAGDMVYVKTNVKQVVCVVDSSGSTQTKVIEPSLGYSFYGKPPFKLLTSGLASTEVYFQGLKVRPVNPDAKTILLVQVD